MILKKNMDVMLRTIPHMTDPVGGTVHSFDRLSDRSRDEIADRFTRFSIRPSGPKGR
jgi:hypothetical protein